MERIFVRRLGVLVSVLTFLLFVNSKGVGYEYILLFTSVLFFLSVFCSFGAYLQVGCICITSIVTCITHTDLGWTIGQVTIMVLLAEKYGFLDRYLLRKVSIGTGVFLITFLLYFYCKSKTLCNFFSYIGFLGLVSGALFILKNDDRYGRIDRENRLKHKIKELEKILDTVGTDFINPVEAGLTKAELLLLENLCRYHETNAGLAIRLSKSEYTIKNQLKNILVKIDVSNRHQLIDVCKNYYLILD